METSITFLTPWQPYCKASLASTPLESARLLSSPMVASLDLWFEYLLRFSHLVAGIAWIGSSFYFIRLDSSFESPESPRQNIEGEVFMVHGGFYYQVEKKKIASGELPKVLHWFKWEATLTLITGYNVKWCQLIDNNAANFPAESISPLFIFDLVSKKA